MATALRACESDKLEPPAWMEGESKWFLQTALVAVAILVVLIELDGIINKKATITGITRIWNADSGGILALVLAALWVHCFLVGGTDAWISRQKAIDINCAT